MRKHHESAADRIWKEKCEACASRPEAILLLFLIATLLVGIAVLGN
jgi:hypothetical protein